MQLRSARRVKGFYLACMVSCLLGLYFATPFRVEAQSQSTGRSAGRSAPSQPFEVRVEPLQGTVEESFVLQIDIDDAGAGTVVPPQFPENEHFAIRLEGQSQRLNIVNGVSSSSLQLNYRVYPSQSLAPGKYKLPDFELVISGTRYPLRGPTITILANEERTTANEDVTFRQVVDTTKPYVGQQVVYRAKLVTSPRFIRGELDEVAIPSVLRESLGSQNQRSRTFANKTLTMVSEVLIPTEVGRITIPARGLTASMRKPMRRGSVFDHPFDSLIMQGVEKQRFVAEGIELDVRPLPPAPPEASDYIPVGKLKVTTSVSTRTVKVGESVNLIIDLYGRANLRPFRLPEPLEEVRGMKVYQDQPNLSTSPKGDQILYRKRFSIALVPTVPGSLQLPRYQIVYFDPYKSRYETLETDSIVVDVSGEALPEVTEEPETAPTQEPEEIDRGGDGLLPQKEGSELYGNYVALSSTSVKFTLFAFPLLYALLALWQRRRWMRNDPIRRARAESLNEAQSRLAAASLDIDELWKVFVDFVNRRIPNAQFTGDASALYEILAASAVSHETAQRTVDFADHLERLRFSGHGGSTGAAADVERLRSLLQELYRETT